MKRHESSSGVRVAGTLAIKRFRDGKLIEEIGPMPNKVVSGGGGYGRNIIARVLAGDNTFPLALTAAAIGSGSTAPADGDIDLQTPVVSGIALTNVVAVNNILTVDVFVPSGSLPNGTYREFGLFCGSRLFARILISPNYTKGTGEDSLFVYTLTITG